MQYNLEFVIDDKEQKMLVLMKPAKHVPTFIKQNEIKMNTLICLALLPMPCCVYITISLKGNVGPQLS